MLRGKAVVLAKNKGASVELQASKNSLLKLISGKKRCGSQDFRQGDPAFVERSGDFQILRTPNLSSVDYRDSHGRWKVNAVL